ncbi:MAG: filamentous hemagglutinin N-terminal domain-containing protein [Aquabacterium sp.]|nr:filamentous hemagglutinin N-terminal domain-containing protein [Aquabacterium sp.]
MKKPDMGLARSRGAGLRAVAAACAVLCWAGTAWAGATTDGTTGAVQSLSGAFTVPQSLGTQRGANLFHSFSRFSVGASESATFTTTDAGIAHVISRVTGGEATLIEGPVRLQAATGSAPSFWFVNPSGIVVGPGGVFDVPAGLHLGTTPELRFADGAVWRTGEAGGSSLTVAAPQGFGFLAAQPAGALQFVGNWSELAPGQELTLAGGDIELRTAALSVPSGTVRVQASGALALTDGARIDAIAYPIEGSGRIEVEAAAVRLDGGLRPWVSGLYAETGAAGGGGIVVHTRGALELTGGARVSLFSVAELGGSALAPIEVDAGSVHLDGNGAASAISTYHNGSAAPGPGLRMRVDGSLQASGSAWISTGSNTNGGAGSLQVQAAQVVLDGGGDARVASISSLSSGAGPSGKVSVTATQSMNLQNGGQIYSSTLGPGDAGDVHVTAPIVRLDGAEGSITSINSGSYGDESRRAGEVRLDVGQLDLRGPTAVSAETRSILGSAGSVVVRADRVTIDGLGSYSASINALAVGDAGDAGRIDVQARESLVLRDGGALLAGSLGQGRVGSIAVATPLLRVDGTGALKTYTGIGGDAFFYDPQGQSSQRAGVGAEVVVDAAAVQLVNGGVISSATNTTADAGSVTLRADTLLIDGGGGTYGATGLSTDGASSGRAGSIRIEARRIDVRAEGSISSSAVDTGPGGLIDVQAQRLTLDSAGGIYSVAASSGNAGSITLNVTEALVLSRGGAIAANTGGEGAAGTVVIRAGALTAEGRDPASGLTSRIVSRALVDSGGRTGSVDIDVSGPMVVRDHAELGITNRATVADPTVLSATALRIRAGSLLVQDADISAAATGNTAAGRVDVQVAGDATLERAGILTSAIDGDGGSLALHAGGTLRLRDARITTSVEGRSNGNGGGIDLAAGALVMQSGFVQANTAAPLASGGQVQVSAPVLLPDGSRVAIGGSQIESFRPGIAGGNVIQAAAPDGVAGTLAVTLPQVDVAAGLVRLAIPRIDFGPFGRDLCEAGDDSSFTVLGRGALPPRAGSPLRIVP